MEMLQEVQTQRTKTETERRRGGTLALSVREAAAELGVGRNTMLELIHSGRVRSVRAGRRILVPREALVEYLSGAEDTED